MTNIPPVFIQAAAVSASWADPTLSLTDLIFRTVSQAVRQSGVDPDAITSVVLAAHDLVDGRSLSSMVTAPAAGAYLRDEIRLAEDGLAALSLAAARVEAREARYSIVAAWGRASEGDYSRTSRTGFDPFVVQPLGISEFDLSALRLSGWLARHGDRPEDRVRAAAARRSRAALNPRSLADVVRPPVAAPLADCEAPRMADVVAAMVIGASNGPVRLAGFGHSAEGGVIGERKLHEFSALREAVERASRVAKIDVGAADLFELAGPTLSDEALAFEALGLAAAGEGFAAYADDGRFNPSGGSERGWCFPVGGLMNSVEAWLQLTGEAGAVQLGARPRTALVTGLSPSAGQIAHAAFLEAAS